MYKSYTASDYLKFLKLPSDYKVDGFIDYGASFNKTYTLDQFEEALRKLNVEYRISKPESEILFSISEIKIDNKLFWFTNAYGGAELSELLHLACLFGSKKNIHLGCCGGLNTEANGLDLIIPEWSYDLGSSAKKYQPDANCQYDSDKELSDKLAKCLSGGHKISRGPIITCQATLAETWEDVKEWSKQGYDGVEMESATVFAVSNYFKVPAAAIVFISDNLIKEETIMSPDFENNQRLRRQVSQDLFDIAVRELVFS